MATDPSSVGPQQRASRNREAILDAAEAKLSMREQLSVSAVAGDAGVSRPTFYAHFADRAALVEALVARAVERMGSAVEAAEPERGPAPAAMARLIEASWREIARNDGIARAAAADLSTAAMRRAHGAARSMIRELIVRGREEGEFREDLPVDWLVTATLALVQAAAEDVRGGDLGRDVALSALLDSIEQVAVRRG
jgi:AcrR family transcriptional regulator